MHEYALEHLKTGRATVKQGKEIEEEGKHKRVTMKK